MNMDELKREMDVGKEEAVRKGRECTYIKMDVREMWLLERRKRV